LLFGFIHSLSLQNQISRMVVFFVRNGADTLRCRIVAGAGVQVGPLLARNHGRIQNALGICLRQVFHIRFNRGRIVGRHILSSLQEFGIVGGSVLVAVIGANPNHGRTVGRGGRDRDPALLQINDIREVLEHAHPVNPHLLAFIPVMVNYMILRRLDRVGGD